MPDSQSHIALLEDFRAVGKPEERSRAMTLDLLRDILEPFSRSTFVPGHVTASGIVLSPDGTRVLVIKHRRLNRWLQPGGHVEPLDRHTRSTAAREVREETGISLAVGVDAHLIGIDVHEIPETTGEPTHYHYDLCYRFEAISEAVCPSDETEGAEWWTLDELRKRGVDVALRRYARRVFEFGSSTFPTN